MSNSVTITLWFSSESHSALLGSAIPSARASAGSAVKPILERVHFFHPLAEGLLVSERGTQSVSATSFSWTTGVKALSSLVLREKLRRLPRTRTDVGTLAGEKGSFAATLDYCLSKQPQWLMDMFGIDSRGKSLLRRIIHRKNPERKSGPVVRLSLNESVSFSQLRIFLNNELIEDGHSLELLLGGIEGASSTTGKSDEGSVSQDLSSSTWFLQRLRNFYEQELKAVLRETDIFNRLQLQSAQSLLREDVALTKLTERFERFLPDHRELSDSRIRLGVFPYQQSLAEEFTAERPLRVALTSAHVGCLALFVYLRDFVGLNISINFRHVNTVDIERSIIANEELPFDVCALALATSARLTARVKSISVRPLMIAPKNTYSVMMPGQSKLKDYRGTFLCMSDEPTTSYLYFEELKRRGHLSMNRIEVAHAEQDEIVAQFADQSSDLMSILWFPFDVFNIMFNGARYSSLPRRRSFINEIFFSAPSVHLSEKVKLSLLAALRDAWSCLRSKPGLVSKVVQKLLSDDEYLSFLARCGGIDSFRSKPSPLSSLSGDDFHRMSSRNSVF